MTGMQRCLLRLQPFGGLSRVQGILSRSIHSIVPPRSPVKPRLGGFLSGLRCMSSIQTSIKAPLKHKRPEPKDQKDPKKGVEWDMVLVYSLGASIMSYNVYYYFYVHEAPAAILSPEDFNEFALTEIVPVSHDTSLFKFKAKVLPVIKGSQVPAPSHIVIKDDSCQIARAYTPISFLKDSVEILVKKYPDGSISPMLHGLQVGEKVHMRGPITTVPYRSNAVKELGMVLSLFPLV
jgi:hypothetical protein